MLQLLCEQQKLAYIAGIKARRVSLLWIMAFIWLFSGGIIVLAEKFLC